MAFRISTPIDQVQNAKLLQDLTIYVKEPYCFLTCRACCVVVPLSRVPNHFSNKPHNYRKAECTRILNAWKATYLPLHPIAIQTEADLSAWRPPAFLPAPIPELPVVRANHCRYIHPETKQRCATLLGGNLSCIQRHCRLQHSWKNPQSRGRPSSHNAPIPSDDLPWEPNVPCQRLTQTGNGSSLWRVRSSPDGETNTKSRGATSKAEAQMLSSWESLEDRLDKHPAMGTVASGTTTRYPINFSPWLEKTGWARYLEGHDLAAVAELLAPPRAQEAGLAALLQAFDSLIEAARASVLEEKVNVFSLHRVASFVPHRPFKRPLLTKLQEGTYRKYKKTWHKLLCFVYRSVVFRQGPSLRYVLTPAQLEALGKLLGPNSVMTTPDTQLDWEPCLDLCIALLDHKLHGQITESIVVAFLAALGINQEHTGFATPLQCTPDLLALVKMAQLVVVQFAVREYDAGRTQFPGELIAELQDRFMVFGSETPMNWILHLRAYGAKIRDASTSLGFVSWSDDGQQLSYKSLELTMDGLRWFLRDQVKEAQDQLHDLLLLPHGDTDARASGLPHLRLSDVKDDPTVGKAGWSFLQDQRNEEMIGGRQRWLLRRIRDEKRLQKLFFENSQSFQWNEKQVLQYLNFAYAFLRRLILLVHLTGGQPARGTELLTIRWRNSPYGEVRNIFVENGLISFVTSYHKNYSLQSSTKVIHRYLPPEVSELIIYYLWLVVPFLEQLHILSAVPGLGSPGSFFWPATISGGKYGRSKRDLDSCAKVAQQEFRATNLEEKPWISSQLGLVIAEEFKRGLKTTATTLLWRHSAIAISRKHLPEGSKFRRDYSDVEGSSAMDLQAAHTSRMAGSCYARDLREGLGQVASLRAEFRDLSRHWHTCLGFGVIFPPRKTDEGNMEEAALQEKGSNCLPREKRLREEGDEVKELTKWLMADAALKKRKLNENRR